VVGGQEGGGRGMKGREGGLGRALRRQGSTLVPPPPEIEDGHVQAGIILGRGASGVDVATGQSAGEADVGRGLTEGGQQRTSVLPGLSASGQSARGAAGEEIQQQQQQQQQQESVVRGARPVLRLPAYDSMGGSPLLRWMRRRPTRR